MSITLRRAVSADLEALARLHAACFPHDAWDARALANILAMPGASGCFAADSAGTKQGFLFDLMPAGDEAEILTIGVLPEWRRCGIGRALLADLFIRGRSASAAAIVLEVAADNDAALGLYRACGFRSVGRRIGYYRRGPAGRVDAWILRRDLARGARIANADPESQC